MARFLIVFSSKYGQTEKISQFIADEVRALGHGVVVASVENASAFSDPTQFDSIVLGAPIYRGNYPKPFRNWLENNLESVSKRPCAFFSVCLAVLNAQEKSRNEVQSIVNRFLLRNHWRPDRWTVFAGALPYLKYNWFLKRIMRRISRNSGVDTQLTRNYEYTDWEAVSKFAKAFVAFSDKKLKVESA
jgi:menaquinone-dependent protoporphyrinogen oxidase